MLLRVTGIERYVWIIGSDDSNCPTAFIFSIKESQKRLFEVLDHEDEGITILQNVGNYLLMTQCDILSELECCGNLSLCIMGIDDWQRKAITHGKKCLFKKQKTAS
jgi:hypothetical protein